MREKIVNRQVNPLLADLPAWAREFRPHQRKAIHDVLQGFDSGVPVVVLDAPTGSGKTLIAECVRRMLETKAAYICSTKSLQQQFVRDYPYAKLLKGRSNYPTQLYPEQFHPGEYMGHLSAEDCTWTKQTGLCEWCEKKTSCPYELAKFDALASDLCVLNTSYFLTEANYIGRFSGREFVIADEADTLEAQLMAHVSVEVSAGRMKKYRWYPPSRVTVEASWGEWIEQHLPKIDNLLGRLRVDHTDVRTVREAKYLRSLREKLSEVLAGLDSGYWVYTGRDGSVSFRPSRVDSLGKDALWRHSSRWLLMSATVISAQELLESLGYRDNYELVRVPSTFPVERRRVRVVEAANMAKKHDSDQQKEALIAAVNAILTRHAGERVLLHCVSYDLSRVVSSGIQQSGRRVITYTTSTTRDAALSEFVSEQGQGSVLVAPSMDRGIDLPDEACRVVVVCKVPYPFLGDRQVSARLHSQGGNVWYTVQTIRTLVQMFGRAMRSETDHFTGYLLDSQFRLGLWSRGRGLFPSWFTEAIDWRASL